MSDKIKKNENVKKYKPVSEYCHIVRNNHYYILPDFTESFFQHILFSAIITTASNYKSTTPKLSIPFWIFFMPIIFGFGLLLSEHINDFFKAFKREE